MELMEATLHGRLGCKVPIYFLRLECEKVILRCFKTRIQYVGFQTIDMLFRPEMELTLKATIKWCKGCAACACKYRFVGI